MDELLEILRQLRERRETVSYSDEALAFLACVQELRELRRAMAENNKQIREAIVNVGCVIEGGQI